MWRSGRQHFTQTPVPTSPPPYPGRIGKEDEIEDSDEEGSGTKRGEVVTKAAHNKVVEAMAAKDKVLAELQAKMGKVESALQEKTAKERLWGEALQDLKVGRPDELRELAETHRRVMKELGERTEREKGEGGGGGM